MILKTNYSSLEENIKSIKEVVTNKVNAKEESQNLVFWVKPDNTVLLVGYSAFTVAAVKTPITVELEAGEVAEEKLVQLRFKDVNNILSAYKSLSLTQPTDVHINVRTIDAIITVHEEAVDRDSADYALYDRGTDYEVQIAPLHPNTEKSIKQLQFEDDGQVILTGELLIYLDFFLPQIANETTESTNAIFFTSDYIYVKPTSHVTTMANRLANKYPQFNNVKWNYTIGMFIKSIVSKHEHFKLRTVTDDKLVGRGATRLEIEVEGVVAHITVPQIMANFDITPYLDDPENTFTVNKRYLTDVLRRMPDNENVVFKFINKDGQALVEVGTKKVKQEVPVVSTVGEGTFAFAIKSEFVQKMMIGYITDPELEDAFPSLVNFNFGVNDKNRLEISLNDHVGAWRSKLVNLKQM